jgi:adenosylmethionine-8-amino-7-oxononanoate aminotransferase
MFEQTALKTSPIWHPFTQAKTAPPPLKVLRGSGAVLELEDGRQIIDCISSWWVNIHGHSQPEIAQAIYEQAQKLEHVMLAGFTHEPAEALARGLLKHLPAGLEHVFFSDNGTTAVEAAMKMAYQSWQNKGEDNRKKFIAFDQGYHGETVGAMSLGKTMPFFEPFRSMLFDIDVIPFPATWHGDTQVEERENVSLSRLKSLLEAGAEKYVGIIVEPLIQGVAGMRICRAEFMQALDKLARENDLLVIYDEVMTGFGRTGDWFACNKTGVTPDIICLAKGISGGFLPLAVTIATDEIYQAFYSDDLKQAFLHSHSYMGNALACAAGNASLRILERNFSACVDIETMHTAFIEKWIKGNKFLEKPRQCGTIAAFDVVTDGDTNYFNRISLPLRQEFLDMGFLIRPLGNTIYLMPPYCITYDQLESAYKAISETVTVLAT